VRLSTTSIDCGACSFYFNYWRTLLITLEVFPTPVPPFKTKKVFKSDKSLFQISFFISGQAKVSLRYNLRGSIILASHHFINERVVKTAGA